MGLPLFSHCHGAPAGAVSVTVSPWHKLVGPETVIFWAKEQMPQIIAAKKK